MFANLSQREKNLLYGLLAIVIMYVLYQFVWLKQSAVYSEAKAEYELMNSKVLQYRNTANTLNTLKKEELELQKKLEQVTSPYHIDIMGGEQMRTIGEIIEKSGLQVEAAAPLATKDQKDYFTQDILFNVYGSYGALEQFFYDTEESQYAFVIKNFNILPKTAEGTDPALAALNYDKLTATITVSVIGDKAAKVDRPAIKTIKFDLFKPSEAGMHTMKQIKQAADIKNQEAQGVGQSGPPITNTPVVPSPPEQSTPEVKNPEPTPDSNKVTPVVTKKQDKITYSFEKK